MALLKDLVLQRRARGDPLKVDHLRDHPCERATLHMSAEQAALLHAQPSSCWASIEEHKIDKLQTA